MTWGRSMPRFPSVRAGMSASDLIGLSTQPQVIGLCRRSSVCDDQGAQARCSLWAEPGTGPQRATAQRFLLKINSACSRTCRRMRGFSYCRQLRCFYHQCAYRPPPGAAESHRRAFSFGPGPVHSVVSTKVAAALGSAPGAGPEFPGSLTTSAAPAPRAAQAAGRAARAAEPARAAAALGPLRGCWPAGLQQPLRAASRAAGPWSSALASRRGEARRSPFKQSINSASGALPRVGRGCC